MESCLAKGPLLLIQALILASCATVTGNVPFESNVNNFAQHLKRYAKHSLGVDILQNHFDIITSSDAVSLNASATLDDIVGKFGERISIANTVLQTLQTYIESDNRVNGNTNGPKRRLHDCCGYNDDLLWDNLLQSQVNLNDFCEISPRENHTECPITAPIQSHVRLFQDRSILQRFKDAYKNSKKMVRFIYYGREDGYYVQYPAQNNFKAENPCGCAKYDPRFAPWYITTMTPADGKDVILALDFSTDMQLSSLRVKMINVVKILLDSLGDRDRVLVALFRQGRLFGALSCMDELSYVTPALINALKDFVEGASFSGSLNYRYLFETSFDKFDDATNRKRNLYVVSSGKNQDLRNIVTAKIREKSREANCSVTVNIFLITTGSLSPARHEDHRAFAEEVCTCSWCTNSGQNINQPIEFDTDYNDIEDLRSRIGKIYSNMFQDEGQGNLRFTLPHLAFNSAGTYLDACTQCMSDNKKIIGVACVSFLSKELFGLDINQDADMYMFLIDRSGKTFIHPKFAEPVLSEDRPFPLDIRKFETSNGFEEIYDSMKSGLAGHKNLLVNASIPKGAGQAEFIEKNYTYHWQSIADSPFSIAVVISSEHKSLPFNVTKGTQKETYGRLDLYNDSSNACLIKNTIAIASTSSIELPPQAFKKPVTYYEDETLQSVNELTNYLEMKTNITPAMLASPDSAASYRDSIVATSILEKVWENDTSIDSVYSMWRYVGTEDGAFRTFPAHRSHPYYDPRVRPWYIQAKANRDDLILTTPYEDAGTGTTLITLAKTVFKRHGGSSVVAGVMGIDFSLPYLQSLIFKYIKECETEIFGSRCVIIDESGYLIFHPDFKNATAKKTHIIDKEPEVAEHLINVGLMKKDYCIGYFKNIVKGFVATSHVKWFYGVKHIRRTSEQEKDCLNYILTPILGTNMVLLKIKKTCGVATGCTCPHDDRTTCVKSNTNNLKICECPCYDYKVCLKDLPPLESSLICEAPDKRTKIKLTYIKSWLDANVKAGLKPCVDPMCYRSHNSLQCYRLGCQWCYKYGNGTIMDDRKKFCGKSDTCPSAILSTQNPTTIATTTSASSKQQDTNLTESSKLSGGEITAAVLVPIIVLAIVLSVIIWYVKCRNGHKTVEIGLDNLASTVDAATKPPVKEESDWY